MMRFVQYWSAGGENLPVPTGQRADASGLRTQARDAIVGSGSRASDDGIISRVVEFVVRQIDRLGNALSGGSSPGLTALAWGLVVVVVLTLIFILWRARRALLAEPVRDALSDDVVGRPPTDWRDRAMAAETSGDFREAMRCWIRMTIAEWNQRGVVVERAGKTLGEYRLDAFWTLAPQRYQEFSELSRRFESIWYGRHPVVKQDVVAAREFADSSRSDVALRAAQDAQFGDLMVAP